MTAMQAQTAKESGTKVSAANAGTDLSAARSGGGREAERDSASSIIVANINDGSSDSGDVSGSNTKVSVPQRIVSSLGGAVVTSLIVTPLDVVKTRMQSQHMVPAAIGIERHATASATDSLSLLKLDHRCLSGCYEGVISGTIINSNNNIKKRDNGRGVIITNRINSKDSIDLAAQNEAAAMFNGSSNLKTVKPMMRQQPQQQYAPITGTLDGIIKIARHEGLHRLYSGIQPTLLMAVPNTVLYFTCYDELKNYLERHFHRRNQRKGEQHYIDNGLELSSAWIHMLSGSIARTVAVITVAPIEYVRTRVQAGIAMSSLADITKNQANSSDHNIRSKAKLMAHLPGFGGGVWATLVTAYRQDGVLALYRGVLPTLLRDVPFSALYFAGYERLKSSISKTFFTSSADDRLMSSSMSTNGEYSEIEQKVGGKVRNGTFLETFGPSFIAGLGSGALASIVTTPADVIKTQIQVQRFGNGNQNNSNSFNTFNVPKNSAALQNSNVVGSNNGSSSLMTMKHPSGASSSINTSNNTIVHHTAECIERRQHLHHQNIHHQGNMKAASERKVINMLETARTIVRTQGYMGLFTGVVPRVAKVAPACGIMISSYEVGKWFFGRSSMATVI